MQPVKICPECKTPAQLSATVCASCGHKFRTKFVESDTTLLSIPAADLPGAATKRRRLLALLLVPLLLLTLIGGYVGYRRHIASPFVGKWRLADGSVSDVFNADGTGSTTIYVMNLTIPFRWKQNGSHLVIHYDRSNAGFFGARTPEELSCDWAISEGGRTLTVTPDADATPSIFHRDESP